MLNKAIAKASQKTFFSIFIILYEFLSLKWPRTDHRVMVFMRGWILKIVRLCTNLNQSKVLNFLTHGGNYNKLGHFMKPC